MTNKMFFAALAATLLLAGCGRERMAEFRKRRSEKHYQSAMADYSAGRMEDAKKGFLAAIKANPANASARFQLACLLQQNGKDYIGAICNFREYAILNPESDKTPLAKKREEMCLEGLRKSIRREMELDEGGGASLEKMRKELAESKRAADAARKAAEKAQAQTKTLQEENVRLRKMVALVGNESESAAQNERDISAMVKSLDAAEKRQDRVAIPEEVLRMAEEEEARRLEPVVAARAVQTDSKREKTLLETLRDQDGGAGADEEKKPDRPSSYVVQEGDTLYRIAVRFYGKMSAWSEIRDANKTIISTDGRVRAGQRIVLP